MLAIDAFKPSDRALLEAAQSGVTTMYLTQGSANVVCGIGAIVKTWGPTFYEQIVNPAAGMKMAMGENPKRVYGGKGKIPATRMAVAALLRETFTATRNYLAKKEAHENNGDGGEKNKGPFETNLKHEAVGRLLNGEFQARCHAHRAIDMLTFMRIAEEFGFEYTFEHATECTMILDDLVRQKVSLIIGPSFGGRSKLEVHHKDFGTVREAVAAGLTVAVTADHNVTPMRYLNVYAALAVREGLANDDALKTITINPAKILGIDAFLGSIEIGKQADLVIWTGDPLDVRSRPECVLIRGRRVATECPSARA